MLRTYETEKEKNFLRLSYGPDLKGLTTPQKMYVFPSSL